MKRSTVESMIESAGLRMIELQCNRHWKARVRRADGSETSVVFSKTSSDHRAIRNKETQLRKIALGAPGMGRS